MSRTQPECDCGVRPGVRHESGCNALRPADEQNPAVILDSERQARQARGEE